MSRHVLTVLVLLIAHRVLAADVETIPASGRRPTQIWNRSGPLGETPNRVTDAYPLSDQENKRGWVKFEPMSDEFDGSELDLNKWSRGMYWWKGRQPALFSDHNVSVSDGKLHLTMRKETLPPEAEKLGYRDYTSAALHTKARSGYGYYEVRARPMDSAGSSSFWFQVEDIPGWLAAVSDLRQRNHAEVVWDARRGGSTIDLQRRIRAGLEHPPVFAATESVRGHPKSPIGLPR